MIYLIGDIHGDFHELKQRIRDIPPEATIIQVGDFGIWPVTAARWKTVAIDRDIYFIDGNHDYMPWLDADSTELVEIWPHALYVPRGYVRHIGDQKVLFLGGSKSVDRAFRVKNSEVHGWFDAEQLTEAQAERAMRAERVDVMITHAPPDCVIRQHFSKEGLVSFGINPETWVDESARRVEKVWRALDQPKLYCGHMHKNVTEGTVRILNTYEVVKID